MTTKMTASTTTGKKASKPISRAPQKKPKVEALKRLADAFDEADEHARTAAESDRPFYDMRGEYVDGLRLELEEALWNQGFRAGIEYCLTGDNTKGLTDLWAWVNAVRYHKSVGGNVEYVDGYAAGETVPVPQKRRFWKRS